MIQGVSVFESVRRAMGRLHGFDPARIRCSLRLRDAGYDRCRLFQLAAALEEEHHVYLFEPDLLQVLTVGGLVDLVRRELALLERGEGVPCS